MFYRMVSGIREHQNSHSGVPIYEQRYGRLENSYPPRWTNPDVAAIDTTRVNPFESSTGDSPLRCGERVGGSVASLPPSMRASIQKDNGWSSDSAKIPKSLINMLSSRKTQAMPLCSKWSCETHLLSHSLPMLYNSLFSSFVETCYSEHRVFATITYASKNPAGCSFNHIVHTYDTLTVDLHRGH